MNIREFIKTIELQRFMLGYGMLKFSKFLGINYHTYNSFKKQDKRTQPKTIKILLEFALSKGIAIDTLDFY